jgi:hypothetical protein
MNQKDITEVSAHRECREGKGNRSDDNQSYVWVGLHVGTDFWLIHVTIANPLGSRVTG